MKKLALLLLLALCGVAQAQQMTPPWQQSAMGCAYNASPSTLTSGWLGFLQCDSSGKLIVSGSFSGAVTVADGADVTQGALADAAATAGGTGSVSAKLRLMTTQLGTLNTTLQTPITGVSQAQYSAAASSIVAKASAGSVVSISGSAANGSYIMLFNATSAPADGAVTPVKCWGPMAAAGPFSFGWGPGPVLTMATGITVVSSSTGCFTKTATNAPFISVEYQ